ncbi:hypothetical protein [Flavobacterium sp.]|uniref:hypothetical protein n=1 Tax=Flavobacterium sp. TaxID=239 RepID=UPI00374CC725
MIKVILIFGKLFLSDLADKSDFSKKKICANLCNLGKKFHADLADKADFLKVTLIIQSLEKENLR